MRQVVSYRPAAPESPRRHRCRPFFPARRPEFPAWESGRRALRPPLRFMTVSGGPITNLDDLTQRTAFWSRAAGSLQVGYPLLDVLAQPAHGPSVRTADFQRRGEPARFDQSPKGGSGNARHLEHIGDSEKLLLHCWGRHLTLPFSLGDPSHPGDRSRSRH